MKTCTACREQQTNEYLCLACIEDLNFYLREIPVLYDELDSVRLPGSLQLIGPRTSRPSSVAPPSPVRLEVLDLLDGGEVIARLMKWTDLSLSPGALCAGFRSHLLATAAEPWAGDFHRDMKGLCRDLGRAVGQPQEQSVGKCSEPTVVPLELCRGALYRAEAGGVYCRRCGHKPELKTRQVWVSCQHAAMVTGRPLKTIRTWRDRRRVSRGRLPMQDPAMVWLPDVIGLAERVVATVPQSSAIVSPGSGAELSSRLLTEPTDSVDGQRSDPRSAELADRSVCEASIHPTGETAPADHQAAGSTTGPSAVRKEAKRLREPAFPGFESPVVDGPTP